MGTGSQHICASAVDCPLLWVQITRHLANPSRLSLQQERSLEMETDPELAKARPRRNFALVWLGDSKNVL